MNNQIFTKITIFAFLMLLSMDVSSQIQYGTWKTTSGNTDYHHFVRNGGGAAVYINQISTSYPILRLSSGTASANQNVKFTVENNGSVGIGTTSTGSHKLAVEGSVGAREVVVEASGWADFVFEDEYELMPLTELGAFVQKNNHLPDIPTAQEVEEEGIALGKMDAKLLQKIEELTLYIIQQQKQMEMNKQVADSTIGGLLERIQKLEEQTNK